MYLEDDREYEYARVLRLFLSALGGGAFVIIVGILMVLYLIVAEVILGLKVNIPTVADDVGVAMFFGVWLVVAVIIYYLLGKPVQKIEQENAEKKN